MKRSVASLIAIAALVVGAAVELEAKPRVAVVKKSSKARAKPTRRAAVRFGVDAGERVVVLKGRRRWVKVAYGRKRGWVRRSRIHMRGDGWRRDRDDLDDRVVIPDKIVEPRAEPEAAESSTPPRPDGFASELRASFGVVGFASTFASNGVSALGGYEVSAGAVGGGIGGRAGLRRGELSVAVDGRYRVAVGSPGIRFHRDDGSVSGTNRFTISEIDATVVAGFALDRDIDVGARAGVHDGTFWIDELQDNPGLIARERLTGPTVGAELAMRISPDLRITAHLDVLISASLEQTENLEDGMESNVRGVSGGAAASYRLGSSLAVELIYRARRTWLEFDGPSARINDVTSAERTDQIHALAIAASRSF